MLLCTSGLPAIRRPIGSVLRLLCPRGQSDFGKRAGGWRRVKNRRAFHAVKVRSIRFSADNRPIPKSLYRAGFWLHLLPVQKVERKGWAKPLAQGAQCRPAQKQTQNGPVTADRGSSTSSCRCRGRSGPVSGCCRLPRRVPTVRYVPAPLSAGCGRCRR